LNEKCVTESHQKNFRPQKTEVPLDTALEFRCSVCT